MIFTIGETLLDIIFKTLDDLSVKPGGSMLNTAVSLGRLGMDVNHISVLSADKASDILIGFLNDNGVHTHHVYRNSETKTSLALAFLDKNNNAEYSFYKDKYELQVDLNFPIVCNGDYIHYGSFFSINQVMHNQLHKFLDETMRKKTIRIYDPNFRKPHLPQLPELMPMIENNFLKADIVKGSDEDFQNIFGIQNGKEAWKLMQDFRVRVLFYTKGNRGSEVYTSEGMVMAPTKKINILSTVGAGDTFTAGIIFFLNTFVDSETNLEAIPMSEWEKCLQISNHFAGTTCQSEDNYLSKAFCKSYLYE